jgi:hypothetical protein
MRPKRKGSALARLVVLVVLTSFNWVSTRAAEPESMSIKLKLDRKNSESLRVTFHMRVAQEFRVHTADLPWMTPPSLTFIVIPIGEGQGLRRVYPLQAPVTGITLLQPGQTYEGAIDLTEFFPGILEANARKELLFFWHWSPDNLTSPISKGTGGWIRIPRAPAR